MKTTWYCQFNKYIVRSCSMSVAKLSFVCELWTIAIFTCVSSFSHTIHIHTYIYFFFILSISPAPSTRPTSATNSTSPCLHSQKLFPNIYTPIPYQSNPKMFISCAHVLTTSELSSPYHSICINVWHIF